MASAIRKTRRGRGWFSLGVLAAAPMAMVLAGCSPEGTGTVDVGKPGSISGKPDAGASGAANKPVTAKQAKDREVEAKAGRTIPKLD